jgi:hypothetical protein
MTGFPGTPSYSEVLARQLREEREAARTEPEPVPRTEDADDFCDALFLRARLTEAGDRKTARMLERAAETIRRLEHEIVQLRNQNRKAGTSEAK